MLLSHVCTALVIIQASAQLAAPLQCLGGIRPGCRLVSNHLQQQLAQPRKESTLSEWRHGMTVCREQNLRQDLAHRPHISLQACAACQASVFLCRQHISASTASDLRLT